jgi:hypothetical protein
MRDDHPPVPARLGDREFRFAMQQYGLLADRVTELQKEREQWVRTSIVATFAFFGWLTVYRDSVVETFMFGTMELQAIYFLPVVLNAGGALRFYFIQRDINRLANFLVEMERSILCLPDALCRAADGKGIRDRHWHVQSIAYWACITGLSGAVALTLGLSM